MREKPDHLGLCHRDGCGEKATLKARLLLRGTILKARTTVWVCDKHQKDAKDYILNNENREKLVELLVDNNFSDKVTAQGLVRHCADVEFFDPYDKANYEVA